MVNILLSEEDCQALHKEPFRNNCEPSVTVSKGKVSFATMSANDIFPFATVAKKLISWDFPINMAFWTPLFGKFHKKCRFN